MSVINFVNDRQAVGVDVEGADLNKLIQQDPADGKLKLGDGSVVGFVENFAGAITGATTLTAADTGKTYYVGAASSYPITLPAPAAGVRFKFFGVSAVSGFAATLSFAGVNLYADGLLHSSAWPVDLSTYGTGVEVWSDGGSWFAQSVTRIGAHGSWCDGIGSTAVAAAWVTAPATALLSASAHDLTLSGGGVLIRRTGRYDISTSIACALATSYLYSGVGINGNPSYYYSQTSGSTVHMYCAKDVPLTAGDIVYNKYLSSASGAVGASTLTSLSITEVR